MRSAEEIKADAVNAIQVLRTIAVHGEPALLTDK
jgi:hypothetical protein